MHGQLTIQRFLASQARHETLESEIENAFEAITTPREAPHTMPIKSWEMPTQRTGIIQSI